MATSEPSLASEKDSSCGKTYRFETKSLRTPRPRRYVLAARPSRSSSGGTACLSLCSKGGRNLTSAEPLLPRTSAVSMFSDGTLCQAEVHWYEAHGIGAKEYKIRRIVG